MIFLVKQKKIQMKRLIENETVVVEPYTTLAYKGINIPLLATTSGHMVKGQVPNF